MQCASHSPAIVFALNSLPGGLAVQTLSLQSNPITAESAGAGNSMLTIYKCRCGETEGSGTL